MLRVSCVCDVYVYVYVYVLLWGITYRAMNKEQLHGLQKPHWCSILPCHQLTQGLEQGRVL